MDLVAGDPVALIGDSLEDLGKKQLHVVAVEAGGGFVEEEEGAGRIRCRSGFIPDIWRFCRA